MRGQRGATLIELMISSTIVLVALLGFIGVLSTAAKATASGHRRTVTSYLRTAQLERFAVTARDRLRNLALNQLDAWMVDACYDSDSRPIAVNASLDPAFTCPDGPPFTFYRSWIRVEPVGAVPAAANAWTIRSFGERVDATCLDAKTHEPVARNQHPICAIGSTLLTD